MTVSGLKKVDKKLIFLHAFNLQCMRHLYVTMWELETGLTLKHYYLLLLPSQLTPVACQG